MFRLVSLFFSFLLSLSLSLSHSTWGRVGKIPLSVNGDKYYKLGCSPRVQVLAISRSFFFSRSTPHPAVAATLHEEDR